MRSVAVRAFQKASASSLSRHSTITNQLKRSTLYSSFSTQSVTVDKYTTSSTNQKQQQSQRLPNNDRDRNALYETEASR